MAIQAQPAVPSSAAQALAMVRSGLAFLATNDTRSLGPAGQAEALAGLERAEAALTAARATVLAAFCAERGFEADGQFGPKPWLRAFTRVTRGAAAGAMAWMHRLAAHPAVAAALASEQISASWAREICGWTDRLPSGLVQDADVILLAAAAGGADLPDLAVLAWEMIERSASADGDDGDGFADRSLWLETTLAGAGRLAGDLTPACAAAVTAVLEALGAKAGPEDTRSLAQRRHDALEEACHRLIAAGLVPGRDGQPLHVYAHMDLASLTARTTAPSAAAGSALEARWPLARTVTGPGVWCPAGPDAAAAACDATVIPATTGHPDLALIEDLVSLALPAWVTAHDPPSGSPATGPTGRADDAGPDTLVTPEVLDRLRRLVLDHAVALLSGPTGLAAALRTQSLSHPLTGRGQPLDLGTPTPIIPPQLRRAVALRDQHCRFPGCIQPPSVCQIHHLRPRADDGPTALGNLALLCRFHHLTAVHRWGWTLACHSDGTTTATSPDGRVLASPPVAA
jgi:hypothetical protein